MAAFEPHRHDDDALLALDAELNDAIDPRVQALLDLTPDDQAALDRYLRRSQTNRLFGYGAVLLAMPLMLALLAFIAGATLPNTWPLYIIQTVAICLGLVIIATAGFRRLVGS